VTLPSSLGGLNSASSSSEAKNFSQRRRTSGPFWLRGAACRQSVSREDASDQQLVSRILRPANRPRAVPRPRIGIASLGRRRGRPVRAMTATWSMVVALAETTMCDVSCRHRSRRNSINNQWSARPMEMVCGHIEDPMAARGSSSTNSASMACTAVQRRLSGRP
jgi:hypothetical protein